MVDSILQDMRYAARQLRGAPGFTAAVVLTLGASIGATTAIFSLVYSVVLRPLPFHTPERLVRVYATSEASTMSDEVSPKQFTSWRNDANAFVDMAAVERRGLTLSGEGGDAVHVVGARATASYLEMLGVRMRVGRPFDSNEDEAGAPRVAVLGYALWQERFGGDESVVGRSIRLDGVPHAITGVLSASAGGALGDVAVWVPLALTAEERTTVEIGYLDVYARLRPGIGVEAADDELSVLARRVAVGDTSAGARVVPLLDDYVGAYRNRLYVLLGAVALVLLIACANIANLLIARGVARTKELSLRIALGATRARVLRQMLAESLVLGAAGGVLGVGLAGALLRLLVATTPAAVPRMEQAGLTGLVLAFAAITTVGTSILFGLLPAIRASRAEPRRFMAEGGREVRGGVRDRARSILIAGEVALTLVLLVGAGLLIRSAIATQRVDSGIEPAAVWSGRVTLPTATYVSVEERTLAFEQILERMRADGRVAAAAAISVPPFTGLRALGLFVPEGLPLVRDNYIMANLRVATPDFAEVLGLPVRGRMFDDRDDSASPPVVVVNEEFARVAWPGEDAIGKRVYGPGGGSAEGPIAREVIAVVGGINEDGPRTERPPAVYYPLRQLPATLWEAAQGSLTLIARTSGDAAALAEVARSAVRTQDAALAISDARTLEERAAELLAMSRFNTRLLTMLGLAGLGLAVLGIYGVVAYLVGQRTRELGLRMALGSTRSRLIALLVRQSMTPVLAGLVGGAILSLALARLLTSQLYRVSPHDPVTFGAVMLLIVSVAVIAAAVPANRAARMAPRHALDL